MIGGIIGVMFVILGGKCKGVDRKEVIKGGGWNIVVFCIGMYVVVFGVKNVGIRRIVGDMVRNI